MATPAHLVPVTFEELVPSVFEAAYQRLLPQMLALDEDDFTSQVLDIAQVTITVRGAAAKLRPLRDQVAKLPYTNTTCIDDLEDAARALRERGARDCEQAAARARRARRARRALAHASVHRREGVRGARPHRRRVDEELPRHRAHRPRARGRRVIARARGDDLGVHQGSWAIPR